MDAEYGFLCATYGEKSRSDPRELRVEIVSCLHVLTELIENARYRLSPETVSK